MIQIIKIICKNCNQLYCAIIELKPTIINGVLYNIATFSQQIMNGECIRCEYSH